ncbi:hypothetical protein PHLH4_44340 [Pseudomonas sp. St316]|nr:hypothetical protein PHLH4_44340 [Pseudomonas sp. St316]
MKTVMVTGVGAIMGYGLLKSLRAASPSVRLVGTDIYDDAVGRGWCDVFVQAPLTAVPEYGQWLGDTLARHKVDLLIPGSNRTSIGCRTTERCWRHLIVRSCSTTRN